MCVCNIVDQKALRVQTYWGNYLYLFFLFQHLTICIKHNDFFSPTDKFDENQPSFVLHLHKTDTSKKKPKKHAVQVKLSFPFADFPRVKSVQFLVVVI